MSDFNINFEYPWLLLALIPAAAIGLWTYFRISKKYRRTRNRIISLVLNLLILSLSVTVLAGFTISYTKPNTTNEVLLFTDLSHSGTVAQQQKNDFIKSVLDKSGDNFKIGIVTFGRNQIYAAPLSNNSSKTYQKYLSARKPDSAATDISAALDYSADMFTSPKTAKIVLISDGAQTDGDAIKTISSLMAKGIRVDTVMLSGDHGDEVAVIEVKTPTYNVIAYDTLPIDLTLKSSFEGWATIALYDNGTITVADSLDVYLKKGTNTFTVSHTFLTAGAHEIYFEIQSGEDNLAQNNRLRLYVFAGF